MPSRERLKKRFNIEDVRAAATTPPSEEPQSIQSTEPSAPDEQAKQMFGYVENAAAEEEQRTKSVSIRIDAEGKIAWDEMRNSRIKLVKDTLKGDPVVQQMFTTVKSGLIYTDADSNTILGMIAGIETVILTKAVPERYRVHPAAAAKAFAYSDEEHAKIDPLVTSVLNKHADKLPDFYLRWREELLLVKMFAELQANKIRLAMQWTAEIKAHERRQTEQIDENERRGGAVPISQ
jgi:hypothetical protein